jgi:hypothetical protein
MKVFDSIRQISNKMPWLENTLIKDLINDVYQTKQSATRSTMKSTNYFPLKPNTLRSSRNRKDLQR